MATGRITLGSLRGLEGWLWDDRVIGFGARRQTRGIFYYLRYRRDGAQVMRSIGRHGSPWTPDTARNEALRLLGSVVGGNDPFAQSLNSESFGAEIERYLLRKKASLKPRSFEEVGRYVRKHCAPLHRLKLGEIDRRTIAVLLGQIEQASGPIARNRARSALSDLFSWCITEGLLEINPVQGTVNTMRGDADAFSDNRPRLAVGWWCCVSPSGNDL